MEKLIWSFKQGVWTAPFESLIMQVTRTEDGKHYRVQVLVFATKEPVKGIDLVVPRLDLAWRFATLYTESHNATVALRALVAEQ